MTRELLLNPTEQLPPAIDGYTLEYINGAIVAVPLPSLLFGGRIYPTAGTPYPTSDTQSASTFYYGPAVHDKLPLFDGTRFKPVQFTEQSLVMLRTVSCNLSGTTVTLLSGNTSQLVRGSSLTGTGISGSTVIATITSATTFTTNLSMTTGSNISVIISVAAGNYDVFGVLVNGGLQLQLGSTWTNNTTRTVTLTQQNGILVNNSLIGSTDYNAIAAKLGSCLGSICIPGTNGYTADAGNISGTGGGTIAPATLLMYNQYNKMPRNAFYKDTGSHTYNSATIRQWNNDPNAQIQVFLGQPQQIMVSVGAAMLVASINTGALVGLGIDITNNIALPFLGNQGLSFVFSGGVSMVNLGIGLHNLNLLESGNPTGVGMTTLDGYLAANIMM